MLTLRIQLPPAIAVSALLAGCELHASNNDGGVINLAATDSAVFTARGCDGIEVVHFDGTVLGEVAPRGASDSYDDLSIADGILFALDADDGYVTTFAIEAENSLREVARDIEVDVGPYSGISAARSFVAVSGGTCEMTVLHYDGDGSVSARGALEGHRGHPDVALDPAGGRALVSTHFDDEVGGHEFGVVSAALDPPAFGASIGLPGAGFTEGGGTPASWPVRVAFGDGFALAAHGGGLSVIAGEDDLGLSVLTTLALGMEAVDVAVRGTTAYAVGSSPRPQAVEIDVSDPAAPALGRSFAVPGADAAPTAIVVIGDRLYVAAGDAGLVVIDR